MIDPNLVVVAIIFLLAGVGLNRRAARRQRDIESGASRPQWPHDEAIEELVRTGKKIEAIRRHRELFGSDQDEAKIAIDTLQARLSGDV